MLREQLTVLIDDLKDFINDEYFDVNTSKHKYRPGWKWRGGVGVCVCVCVCVCMRVRVYVFVCVLWMHQGGVMIRQNCARSSNRLRNGSGGVEPHMLHDIKDFTVLWCRCPLTATHIHRHTETHTHTQGFCSNEHEEPVSLVQWLSTV